MTFSDIEKARIDTVWQNRIKEEPQANRIRRLVWYIKRNEHEGIPINPFRSYND